MVHWIFQSKPMGQNVTIRKGSGEMQPSKRRPSWIRTVDRNGILRCCTNGKLDRMSVSIVWNKIYGRMKNGIKPKKISPYGGHFEFAEIVTRNISDYVVPPSLQQKRDVDQWASWSKCSRVNVTRVTPPPFIDHMVSTWDENLSIIISIISFLLECVWWLIILSSNPLK